jgi:hypothetical protein
VLFAVLDFSNVICYFAPSEIEIVCRCWGSLSHNYRNRETLNADDARTHLNEHELDTNEKCMTAIRDRIPEKDVKMRFCVLNI